MRIYTDTSVIGGVNDLEFEEPSKELFARIMRGEFTLVVSDILEAELLRAPASVKNYLLRFSYKQIEKVELTKEQRTSQMNI